MVVNKKYTTMFCTCGCGDGVVLRADHNKNIGISLQLVSSNFYSGCNNKRDSIKEKIKRIWYIICEKEYCYFDILIDKDELQEFKQFVARL